MQLDFLGDDDLYVVVADNLKPHTMGARTEVNLCCARPILTELEHTELEHG